jgi:hypothetical protein
MSGIKPMATMSYTREGALHEADRIKKDCISKGIWVDYTEVHKDGLLFITMELSIRVDQEKVVKK